MSTLCICIGALTIPLFGLTESLNVSVAAAIVLHHGRTARTAALERVNGLNAHGGDLSEVGSSLTHTTNR